jgi:hypothetical protein
MDVVIKLIHHIHNILRLLLIERSEEIGSKHMVAIGPSLLMFFQEVLTRKVLYILAVNLITSIHDEEGHQGKGIIYPLPLCPYSVLVG